MATKKKVVATEKPSNLIRVLSDVAIINSSEFSSLAASKQTETVKSAGDKPVRFVPSFFSLKNKGVIRDGLLSGKDMSLELEFNGITLTPEELRVLGLIKPILSRIEALGPSYPWLPEKDFSNTIKFTTTDVHRNGHSRSLTVARTIWKKASKYWSGGEKPKSYTSGGYYSGRTISFHPDRVDFGCQSIPRVEVEFIARSQNWEPVTFEG